MSKNYLRFSYELKLLEMLREALVQEGDYWVYKEAGMTDKLMAEKATKALDKRVTIGNVSGMRVQNFGPMRSQRQRAAGPAGSAEFKAWATESIRQLNERVVALERELDALRADLAKLKEALIATRALHVQDHRKDGARLPL